MQLTLLGTGTSQGIPVIGCDCEVCQSTNPRDKRLRTAGLFHNEHCHIAIDCGPDFRQQMLRNHITQLDAILITHTHNDHIVGLDDVRPFNFSLKRSIPIYGLEEHLDEIKKRFDYVFNANPYPGAPRINCHPIEPYVSLEIKGQSIMPLPVKHGSLDVLGYRIRNKAYITDTNGIPEKTMAKLQDLEVLVLDALHHRPHHSHFNFEQAIEVAKQINADRTYFIHLSHHMGLYEETDLRCPPNMHLAYDGLAL